MNPLALLALLAVQQPEVSEADFADALQSDQAAAAQAAAPTVPAAPVSSSAALQNPETSVIFVSSAGLARRKDVAPSFSAHDDARLDTATLQEIEIALAGDVDPYFQARLFLAIPQLEGIEVEEGYLVSSSLPFNLQVKAGIFRSAFGRNNEQHLHIQDFARRPLTTSLLGEDGLRPAGAQASVLLPLPWYSLVWVEGFALTPRKASASAGLDQFFEFNPAWSLMLGVSAASVAAGVDEHAHEEPAVPAAPATAPPRRSLFGADLYLKWRPANETLTYAWVALTAEYIVSRARHIHMGVEEAAEWAGAGYAQVVAQVARRWRVGVRLDMDGAPATDERPRGYASSASLAFLPTEFSRVRFTYLHQDIPGDRGRRNDFFFLQLEGIIGAHGAHPF